MLDVRRFLAIPYKHKGRDYQGCDCYGLILLFFRDVLNKKLFDVEEEYDKNWTFKNKDYFIENYHKQFEKIEKPEKYDIVLFQNRQGVANHGGVVLGYGKFIHCCRDGVLMDSYNREGWRRRINGFYRLKNEE